MPLGDGYFYDLRKRKLVGTVIESGQEIAASPSHFLSADAHSVWSMSEHS